jgi:hypothetical protein
MTTIAADIDRHHAEAIACAASAVEHAKAAGTLLLQVKAQLPHGEFLPWVQAHLTVSDRQARRYMAAALGKQPARRAIGQSKSDAVSDLKTDTVSDLKTDTVSLLATVPQAEAPKVVPTDPEDDDGPSLAEIVDELQAQLKALTVADQAAELARQIGIRQGIERRLSDEMTKNHRLQKDLDAYGKRYAELRKVTGLQTWPEILNAFRRMAA